MWKVNKIGKEQIWYSEREYKILQNKYYKNISLFLTCLRFINHLRENNCLDKIEIGNSSCRNCLNKIELFFVLYKNYFDKDFDIYAEIDKIRKEKEDIDDAG